MARLGDFMRDLLIFLFSTVLFAQAPIVNGSNLSPTMGPSIQYGPGWTSALKNLLPTQGSQQTRASFIMSVTAPEGDCDIKDTMNSQSGWKSYRFNVPAKQTVTFKLDTTNKSSFRLFTVNRWGDLEEGMLQNTIYRGEPKASYISPKDTVNTIYLVVASDSAISFGLPSAYLEPYTLEVRYIQK